MLLLQFQWLDRCHGQLQPATAARHHSGGASWQLYRLGRNGGTTHDGSVGEQFEITPYAVVLKPSHGLKILSGTGKGFSPKAEYIFRKQLEEAAILLINRIDELEPATVDQIEQLLADQYPGRPILRISGKTGQNVDALAAALAQTATRPKHTMQVDYDVYAEGEAELGWLNATVEVAASAPVEMDQLLLNLIEDLKRRLSQLDVEPAHLKAIGQSDGNSAVVNLVSSDSSVTLSLASQCKATQLELVVNARVAIDPHRLQSVLESAIDHMQSAADLKATIRSIQSFQPGRPVPTHRVSH